jgi:predicted 3-demethylubiquinone-9 3-methyltransferase (glyoxalase superfamily)
MSGKSIQEQLKAIQSIVKHQPPNAVVESTSDGRQDSKSPERLQKPPAADRPNLPKVDDVRPTTDPELDRLIGELHLARAELSNLRTAPLETAEDDQRQQEQPAQAKLTIEEISERETYVLDEELRLQKDREGIDELKSSLEDDRNHLTRSLTEHASELKQLRGLVQLRSEVKEAVSKQKSERLAIDERQTILDSRETSIEVREAALILNDELLKQLRKAEKSLKGLAKRNLETQALLDDSEKKLATVKKEGTSLRKDRNAKALANGALEKESLKLNRAVTVLSKRNVELQEAVERLQETLREEHEISIKSIETVAWLTQNFEIDSQLNFEREVLMVGDGPWDGVDFQDLLVDKGFSVFRDGYAEDVEVLILGRDNWNEAVLTAQFELRQNKTLRVYSQELFVLALALNLDPLRSEDHDTLFRIIKNHSGFDYLFANDCPWPESALGDGDGAGSFTNFGADHSPLFELGYSVAKMRGISMSERHKYLTKAVEAKELPWVLSDDYMNEWGEGDSRQRIHRIAWHISMLTRSHSQHEEAVAKWEADLGWLKTNFYKPFMRFSWPE